MHIDHRCMVIQMQKLKKDLEATKIQGIFLTDAKAKQEADARLVLTDSETWNFNKSEAYRNMI